MSSASSGKNLYTQQSKNRLITGFLTKKEQESDNHGKE
jgi:hypothetical protein